MRSGESCSFRTDWSGAWPDVRVVAVWLPHLPLRVEVLRRPELDGRPLVMGGTPGERRVVRLCSSEAERAGLRPGLPLREVVALCAEAVVLRPDPVRVAAVLDEVVAALQRVSPGIELAEDELFIDLRGLERLYMSAPSPERQVDGALGAWRSALGTQPSAGCPQDTRWCLPETGFAHAEHRTRTPWGAFELAVRAAVPPLLRPRIGAGNGKFAARVAARVALPGGSRVVPSTQTAAFLAPLPSTLLPLERDVLERLELLGLRRIGDFATLPFAAVQAQFGRPGARAWRLVNGQDDEPVVPRRFVQTVLASTHFDDPIASVEAVMVALDGLLARAFADPHLQGRAVRQARLRALLSDGTSWERLFTFKEAVSSRAAARLALRSRLELPSALPPAALEELALELLGLSGEAARQAGLFSAPTRQLGAIVESARQLRARYGHVPLYHAVEIEPWSRLPERRWALVDSEL